jgi:hypothetical protein
LHVIPKTEEVQEEVAQPPEEEVIEVPKEGIKVTIEDREIEANVIQIDKFQENSLVKV